MTTTPCFVAVLCHGVLMYLEEPAPFVAALAELADDDGVVSIAAKDGQPISHPSTAKTTPSPSS